MPCVRRRSRANPRLDGCASESSVRRRRTRHRPVLKATVPVLQRQSDVDLHQVTRGRMRNGGIYTASLVHDDRRINGRVRQSNREQTLARIPSKPTPRRPARLVRAALAFLQHRDIEHPAAKNLIRAIIRVIPTAALMAVLLTRLHVEAACAGSYSARRPTHSRAPPTYDNSRKDQPS